MNARNRAILAATFGPSRVARAVTPNAPTITAPADRRPVYSYGKSIDSYDAALTAVDYALLKEPIYRGTGSAIRKEFRGMFNSKTGTCIGVVGDNFTHYQPRESLEIMRAAMASVPQYQPSWKAVTPLCGGAGLSLYAEIRADIKVPRRVGDTCGVGMFQQDWFDGSGKTVYGIDITRWRCTNGMTDSKCMFSLNAKHTPNIREKIESARVSFGMILQDQITRFQGIVTQLSAVDMTQREHDKFTLRLFDIESEDVLNDEKQVGGKTRNKVAKVRDLFANGTGNEGRSAWDSYNSVTEFVDWHGTFRTTETTTAEENRFVSLLGGNGMKLKDRALSLLLS